ncbi:2Fe-2S iron-sulfur cluster-binding protein [Pseudoalteromonas sp. APC 3358]|uniref:2Fe-2S iron-sulfur cluster-binding protein n=1 Tax=Pseudoalteromonas sp. APC 3358 TaxID=3035176 RepID=UPI0033A76E2E
MMFISQRALMVFHQLLGRNFNLILELLFMIKIITSSRQHHSVESKGTILQSLEQGSVVHKSQCRTGICGYCKCKLKSGSVTYVTEPLGFMSNDEILPCISIANGNIEIEN